MNDNRSRSDRIEPFPAGQAGTDPDREQRSQAIEDGIDAIEMELIRAQSDPAYQGSAFAAVAVLGEALSRNLAIAVDLHDSEDPAARGFAVGCLSMLSDLGHLIRHDCADCAAALVGLLSDSDAEVRYSAAATLTAWRFDRDLVLVPLVEHAAKEDDPKVLDTLRALIGEYAQEAADTVRDLGVPGSSGCLGDEIADLLVERWINAARLTPTEQGP